jgi:cytochrome c biogenesis protein CcmG/thiol:disulfide interchange protein DsbE
MRRWLAFVPLVAFAALGVVFAIGLGRDPAIIPSALIGKPLPAFTLTPVLPQTAGYSAHDLRGRVVLINVFGSWCVSCRLEHPTLMALKAAGAAPIYGLDWKDDPADGAAWLARNGDPYEQVGGDREGRVALDLGVSGAPETFIIDKKGRIAYKQVGAITPDVWRRKLAPLVARLEAEP